MHYNIIFSLYSTFWHFTPINSFLALISVMKLLLIKIISDVLFFPSFRSLSLMTWSSLFQWSLYAIYRVRLICRFFRFSLPLGPLLTNIWNVLQIRKQLFCHRVYFTKALHNSLRQFQSHFQPVRKVPYFFPRKSHYVGILSAEIAF